MRIWGRSRLKPIAVLSCSDWVWGVCPRGPNLLVRVAMALLSFSDGKSCALWLLLSVFICHLDMEASWHVISTMEWHARSCACITVQQLKAANA